MTCCVYFLFAGDVVNLATFIATHHHGAAVLLREQGKMLQKPLETRRQPAQGIQTSFQT